MPIKDWPKEDRPREKLLQKGANALTDAELLAIFLGTGIRGKTALDLARELLMESGNLKKLLNAPRSVKKPGFGIVKHTLLQAAIELGQRYQLEQLVIGEVLNNNKITEAFLSARMRQHPNEVFACLFLDSQCRLIQFEELFQGTINEAAIYPREIARRGLAHNAAKVILAHNHPSGKALPSEADKDVTQIIKETLALVNIKVVDHIIIGNPGSFSFAREGILNSTEREL